MIRPVDEIRTRARAVLEKISEHALKVGRHPDEVKLVAVTKSHPVETVLAAVEAGLRIFGENYAQELRQKAAALVSKNIEWHFIGRIQTNKLKYIVPLAEFIHSVWRIEELEEINRLAAKIGKVQKILIEVNVSGEESKAGLGPSKVAEILGCARNLNYVSVVGLMTMAPLVEAEATRVFFRRLRELRDELRAQFPNLVELSMGMSNDFTVAVEEGSTMVRLGTALFGERP